MSSELSTSCIEKFVSAIIHFHMDGGDRTMISEKTELSHEQRGNVLNALFVTQIILLQKKKSIFCQVLPIECAVCSKNWMHPLINIAAESNMGI